MNEPDLLIEKARLSWKGEDHREALRLLEDPLLQDNSEAALLAGEIHYSCQNWGAALNKFRHFLQIDPQLKAAQTYVELIRNILGFFHTDQFNP